MTDEKIRTNLKNSAERWGWIGVAAVAVLILLGTAGPVQSSVYWGRTVPVAFAMVLAALTGYIVFRNSEGLPVRITAVLLIMFSACLYLPLVNHLLSIIGDNVRYIGSAVGLSEGKGFLDVWRDPPVYQINYGVGMPLLLLPSIWLFPDNVVALKIPIALSGIAGVAGTYLLYRRFRGVPAWFVLVLTLTVTVNGFLVGSMNQVLTEMPYYSATLFALLAIVLYSRSNRNRGWLLVAAVAGVGWSYYVRSNGISLLIAAVMALALKRQWKKILFLSAGVIMLVAPWQMRNSAIREQLRAQGEVHPSSFAFFMDYYKGVRADESGYATHGKSIGENVRIIFGKGLRDQWKWSTEILFGRGDTGWKVMGLLVMLLGLSVHMYRSWFGHREELAVDFYVGGAVLLNLFLGAVVATRYVLVLAPFLFFYWFYGCLFLWQLVMRASDLKHKERIGRILITVMASFMFYPQFAGAMRSIQSNRMQQGYGGAWGVFHEVVQWVGANTVSDTKLVTRKPQMVYPWIKRQAECYPFTADQDSMLAYLKEHDYIIIDAGMGFSSTQKYVAPVVSRYMGRYFKVVHRSRPMYYGKKPFYQYVIQTIPEQK